MVIFHKIQHIQAMLLCQQQGGWYEDVADLLGLVACGEDRTAEDLGIEQLDHSLITAIFARQGF